MDDSLIVNLVQRLDNRHKHLNSFFCGNGFFFFEIFRKRFAFKIFHSNVCGAVCFKAIENLDYARFVSEQSKALGFINEFIHTIAELLAFFARKHGNTGLTRRAG